MRKLLFSASCLLLFTLATVITTGNSAGHPDEADEVDVATVHADVVATGIPGAGAIAQIGTFHAGGPFHDNPAFVPFTQAGQVLDRTRLFVASTSNFGAQLARPNEAGGSILSIDVSGAPMVVPANFAAGGGQATAVGGNVILYTAQSPDFLNGLNNPAAATADRPSVSLPLSISFNNGFGRPWFANAPNGSAGDGTITVIDPSGIPLRGAPDLVAGGVFTGTVTNRNAASIGGLTSAAVATALATKSPDLSIRAVFFAALADGSVAQIHVQKGVDQLVPPGSFTPIDGISTETAESSAPQAITRAGIAFNWVPTRILYVTDPRADRLLALDISDEGTVADPQAQFTATRVRHLRSRFLDKPIDIAPAVPEVGARNFASNTTLGGGSDLYILNRGNNTIVRMTQAGRVLAVRRIKAALFGFRLNGIATSEDARTIWVTATAPDRQGAVLRLPAFGGGAVTSSLIDHAVNAAANGAVAQGADIFGHELEPAQRLGPLFNGRACDSCHNNVAGNEVPGGMGVSADSFVVRVARIKHGVFDPLEHHGGPIARQHSVAELGVPCGLPTGVPAHANATSVRSAMTLRGTSLLDNIRIGDIDQVRQAQPAPVQGRFNVLADGRIGRFGWKAQTATLVDFMAEAFRDEIGLTTPLSPDDLVRGCGASRVKPEADAVPLTSLVAFLNTIDPPVPGAACLASPGATVFNSTGCATCHTPTMFGPGSSGASPTTIRPYTDLLLHDMGPGLADRFEQGTAGGSEFRTMPLWRVSDRAHFLHDGRATSIVDAIRAHGGQAAGARAAFDALNMSDLQALLDYLRCI